MSTGYHYAGDTEAEAKKILRKMNRASRKFFEHTIKPSKHQYGDKIITTYYIESKER